jgi:hypothetical protein
VPGYDFFLSDYDPLSRIAQATSSLPIMPGTIVPNLGFPTGVMRVREVTQTWGAEGSSASLWMGEVTSITSQGPRLASAIQGLAIAAMRPEILTHYEYRVVGQTPDGGYLLQSEVLGPVPDAVPVVHWPGIPGMACKLTPGSKVLVGFRGREPVVVGFDSTPPLEVTWDYLTLNLGGVLAKPVANADVIDAILDLIASVNAAHTGSTTAPYAGFAVDRGAIVAQLAKMQTRSA